MLIDFEQAGIGILLFDLGICIGGTCLNQGEIDLTLMSSLVEGYEEIRPLSKVEKDFLAWAIILGLFSISLWRIDRFTEGNLDPSKKTSYRELLERAHRFSLKLNVKKKTRNL